MDATACQVRLLRPKIAAAFDAGASGYLLWQLNVTNTDGYGIRIGSQDPAFAALSAASRRWATRR